MANTIRALCRPLGFFSRAYTTVEAAPASLPQEISLASTAICIWGSNTGVGKTLFSAGLADACRRQEQSLLYLKPVQTGFPEDSDASYVAAVLGADGANTHYTHGPHAAELLKNQPATQLSNFIESSPEYLVKTLFAWRDPVSPHIAVETEGRPVSDTAIVASVAEHLNAFHGRVSIIETAGGVGSPGPSGSLQSDILRPLLLPSILVGDGKLGGISATLTAYESLRMRGYDVPVIVLMDPEGKNWKSIQRHVAGEKKRNGFGSGTLVLPFGACKKMHPESPRTQLILNKNGKVDRYIVEENLQRWLEENKDQFDQLLAAAHDHHSHRLEKLQHAAEQAKDVFWWPFTQHGGLKDINVVDSRAGEHYAVYSPAQDTSNKNNANAKKDKLLFEYDGCASWWTQGMTQEALPAMARAVGYSTARYGHIIFPQTVHAPALELAQRAVDLVGKGWASRAFFTDNGSTAVEVALKMAFRKYAIDHNMIFNEEFLLSSPKQENKVEGKVEDHREQQPNFAVLGLQEAYHGDTLGAMDAVAPSVFNGPLQTPWFTGRGLFLDPPTVGLRKGVWQVTVPESLLVNTRGSRGGSTARTEVTFESFDDVFSADARGNSELSKLYRSHIERYIDEYEASTATIAKNNNKIAACIIEPVLQGAGGMRLIDPEFQRAMAAACKARKIPLILDEVFTGFWRLGESSAAAMLGVLPDIACYAKLLTGGVVPMALTLASDDVFQAFNGDSKAYALLHGHSYTAHPLGCAAAVQALETFTDPHMNPNLCTPEVPNRCLCSSTSTSTTESGSNTVQEPLSSPCPGPCGKLRPLWDPARLQALSHHPKVDRIVSLGTVIAAELKTSAENGGGYGSNAAAGVVAALRKRGVFARPLGNVVYIMVTPMTKPEKCQDLLNALEDALNDDDDEES
jgi:dethiobiotin synthetase/adenosylmethionine--8-amino-7-oxononanoate aminotransferase